MPSKGTLITVSPDGSVSAEHIEVPDGAETGSFIYDKLRAAVEGPIETIPYFETLMLPKHVTLDLKALSALDLSNAVPCSAFCNEYGMIERKPYNEFGTALWATALVRAGHAVMRTDGTVAMQDVCKGAIAIVIGEPKFLDTI